MRTLDEGFLMSEWREVKLPIACNFGTWLAWTLIWFSASLRRDSQGLTDHSKNVLTANRKPVTGCLLALRKINMQGSSSTSQLSGQQNYLPSPCLLSIKCWASHGRMGIVPHLGSTLELTLLAGVQVCRACGHESRGAVLSPSPVSHGMARVREIGSCPHPLSPATGWEPDSGHENRRASPMFIPDCLTQ